MKHIQTSTGISRRRFLAAAGLVVAAPTIIPSSAIGGGGTTPPSGRVTMGVVGWGMQGPANTNEFLNLSDCRVVAACDIDKNNLAAAVGTVNGKYGNKDCKAYSDYRQMMARKDIDAVMLAVPDNWHALVAIEAAKNKKDIYGEKPLARTIAEQQAIVRAVQHNKRIWQTGSWQRSDRPMRRAAEIVRNGLIGKVKRVEVGLPSGFTDFGGTLEEALRLMGKTGQRGDYLATVISGSAEYNAVVAKPPPELDYETWIGPATMEPYIKVRVHKNWRWNYNIGGGQLLDWIGHHCDIAHWGLDCDQTGGPIEVEGAGAFPPKNAIWNTAPRYRITLKYPNDVTMTIAGGYPEIRSGTKWIGEDDKFVWVDRGGFNATNVDWFSEIPPELYKVKLYQTNGHQRNFIECVKSRQPTITPVETAHHSAIPGHLSLISMRLGRKIKWDSAKEIIVGDAEASHMLTRPYRAPYKFPA